MLLEENLRWGTIQFLPVISQSIPFAILAREKIRSSQFKQVFLEVPLYAQKKYLEGINSLPNIQVLGIEEVGRKQIGFLGIEPTDAFALAAWTAMEQEILVRCIGQNLPKYLSRISIQDPNVMSFLGYKKYLSTIKSHFTGKEILGNPSSYQYLTKHLLESQGIPTLFVLSVDSWLSLPKWLKEKPPLKVEPVIPRTVDIFRVAKSSLANICREIPYVINDFAMQLKNTPIDAPFHFDTEASINRLIHETFAGYPDVLKSPNQKNFIRFLNRLLHLGKKTIPNMNLLLMAGKKCLGEEAAMLIYNRACHYSLSTPIKRKEYVIDFKSKINPLSHPEWSMEKTIRVNKKLTQPLFKTTHANYKPNYPIIRPPKNGSSTNSFETLIEKVRKSVRHHLQLRLQKQFTNIAYPVVIFDWDFFSYPWVGCLPSENSHNHSLIFYAHSYTLEYAYPGKSKCLLGGFACFPHNIEDREYLLSPYRAFNRKNARENEQNYAENLIFWANKLNYETIIPFISPHPPDSSFLAGLENRKNNIYYLNTCNFPEQSIRQLRRLNHLGEKRLNHIASRI